MTFDELWRQDPPRKRQLTYSVDDPAFDDVDRAEMNRYLTWLEKSLQSSDAGECLD
jgi:hypothetical protein